MEKPLVSICSITYNHAPYIRDCIDGFLMQKTNFPIEIIINDDCSTDGTTEIIKEYAAKYPNIIHPIYHDENQYQKGIRGMFQKFVIPQARGKYIALCEGDDYWTDPLKLQKQVDFLESHHEYGAIYGRVRFYLQGKNKFGNEWGGSNEKFEQLMCSNTIPTPTTMFRQELYNSYHSFIGQASINWKMGDYPLWLYIAYKSKIKYSNEISGVYRILAESASHSKSKIKELSFLISYYEIKLWFAQKTNFVDGNKDLCKKWELIQQELKLRISLIQNNNENIKHSLEELNCLLNSYDGIIPRRFKILRSFPYLGIKFLDCIDFIRNKYTHCL